MPIPMISLTNHNELVKMDTLPLTFSVTTSSLVKAINVNRKFWHISLQMSMPPRKKYISKLKFSSCNFQTQVHILEPRSRSTWTYKFRTVQKFCPTNQTTFSIPHTMPYTGMLSCLPSCLC
jgi:hypothetical protein